METLNNSWGWASVFASVIFLVILKLTCEGERWRVTNLICGTFLILFSAAMIVLFGTWEAISGLLAAKGELSKSAHESAQMNSTMWKTIFPFVFGGIGICVVSEWLMSKKPEKPEKI